jgi:hypothetical protein
MAHDTPPPRPRLRDLPGSSEAMIHIASIDNLTKRITDEFDTHPARNLLGDGKQFT